MPSPGITNSRSTYCKCSRQELCKHSFRPGNRKFFSAGPLFVPTRKANAKAFPVCRRVPSIRPDPQTIKALPHPKEIPRRGPRAYRICDTVRENRGPAPGKASQGEAIEGPAFPRRFAGRGGHSCGGVQMSERIFPAYGYGFAPVRIPEKHIRPQKKFPGAGPRAYRICNTGRENRGPVPGKVSPGEVWRDRPLLKRRAPPRSSPWARGVRSGFAIAWLARGIGRGSIQPASGTADRSWKGSGSRSSRRCSG